LKARGLDGWLVYDFHGVNPVAARLLGLGGMGTRRIFVWFPAEGDPVAVAHKIELQPLDGFPGTVRPYASWQSLHEELGTLVRGRRIAMEISDNDDVPYLDRVPWGVMRLMTHLGATVESSADLVSQFAAGWSAEELAGHRRAAEILAEIARAVLAGLVASPNGQREWAIQQDVLQRMARAGLVTTHPPIVGFGPNAANPHYEPREGQDRALEPNQVVLLDLWGGPGEGSVFADQTWMAFTGTNVPAEVLEVWTVVRDARDAAVRAIAEAHKKGGAVGADGDRAAREVITSAGYGEYFVHRTGHSIDTDLHGSGPHLDSFETKDGRRLLPGVGFSVEPGVYLTGRFGVRSEINVYMREDGPEVTPAVPQRDLITPS
ncbi:MAG: Xaa-Pro peptidase family protein, partial [Gemmatimonadales bacterium]